MTTEFIISALKTLLIISLVLNVIQVLIIMYEHKHVLKLQRFIQSVDPIEFDDLQVPDIFDEDVHLQPWIDGEVTDGK